MPWLVLGLSVLIALILAARWFISADPKLLARLLKWGSLGLLVLVAAFLALTGRLVLALPLAILLLPLIRGWLRRRMGLAPGGGFGGLGGFGGFGRFGAGPSQGQSSEVETDMLSMTLDHDSGAISGTIKKGRFGGQQLVDLDLGDLFKLLDECRQKDPESATVIEAYLDRIVPDWRGDESAENSAGAAGTRGAMSREEAWRILGLEPGASTDEIREAHHRLMLKLHPDTGGSTYLASQINQAKEVLESS
ncbi:MAG TPA: DnaJ domain-containing protein [Alphaproteobacteria bacterium]|jgi:hypothetical protein|nr:DnaJ domain-containing protein [Alphaproteobacteria bacterium]MDP6272196.1 DnaJ domain-containing protein [Alphaproteobacteria bacterium]MDP7164832.1 DnaJ domain-containing protein [Alphaproteobacteria bacterium]HJM51935.1 DnaJ domain-containing protein [Alphaproteobacteria bacterium]